MGKLAAHTTDSLRYSLRSYNALFTGQPIFYLKLIDIENLLVCPVLCGVHLSNNAEGRAALLSLYATINMVCMSDDDGDEEKGEQVPAEKRSSSSEEEDAEEKAEREKRRKEREQEELAKLSPYGAKTNAALRLLCDHVPVVRDYYQKLALNAVLKADLPQCRQAAFCLRPEYVNHRYAAYNNRTLLHLTAGNAEPTQLWYNILTCRWYVQYSGRPTAAFLFAVLLTYLEVFVLLKNLFSTLIQQHRGPTRKHSHSQSITLYSKSVTFSVLLRTSSCRSSCCSTTTTINHQPLCQTTARSTRCW